MRKNPGSLTRATSSSTQTDTNIPASRWLYTGTQGLRCLTFIVLGFWGSTFAFAQRAQIQHAPSINGTIDGSVQQMTGESVTLNGGATITGDLLVPGVPTVTINGTPSYSGTQEGTGATTPSGYAISLNSGSSLRHVIRRTNPVSLPVVATVPAPPGTVSVTVNAAGQSISWSNLKNLTLNSNVGVYAVPVGTYGNFSAGSGTGFKLGTAGATQASVYNFQNLTLNGNSSLQVVGPVVINVANGFSANAPVGASGNPSWLALNIKSGGFTLNSGCNVYGYITAPGGTVIINGGTQLVGGVCAAYLTVNGNGLLKLQSPSNQAPVVSLTAPADNATFQAPATFTLRAMATDPDGSVAKVEFFQGTTNLGQSMAATYSMPINGLTAGTYTYFARATDNAGTVTDSNVVTVTVTAPNQPPSVSLTAPVNGAHVTSPAAITLSAAANDSDGTIAKVDFYQGATLLGSDATAPYSFVTSALPAGSYTFTAKAYDNGGASTISPGVTVTVANPNQPPSVSITGPANNTVFDDPAVFSLIASANDSDGTIANVQFFRNGISLGMVTQAPYQFPLSGLAVGNYDFVARATDNQGATADSAPIHVSVVHINDAPVAHAQTSTTPEDTPVTLTLTGSDADGDVLSYVIVASPAHGSLIPKTPPNSFTYIPATNFNGSDSFSFKVSDGSLQSGAATVSLSVTPVNDPPQAYPASVVLDENSSASLTLAGTDVDSSVLSYTILSGPSHGTYSGALPNLTYVPAVNYSGTDSLVYAISDGQLTSAPATISFTINHVNRVPTVALTTPADGARFVGPTAITLSATATDADGSIAKVEFFNGSAKLGEALDAPFQFIWSDVAPGQYTLSAHAIDNSGAMANSATLTVTVIANSLPTVSLTSPVNDAVFTPPTSLPLAAIASDADGTIAKVEFFAGNDKIGEALAAPYELVWSNVGGGDYSITARATDNLGGVTTSAPCLIKVNSPPVAVPQKITGLKNTSLSLTLAGSDPENSPLSFTIVDRPAHGELVAGPSLADFQFIPEINYSGPDHFTFKVSDGGLDSVPVSVDLTIRSNASAPYITSTPILTIVLPSTRLNQSSVDFTPFELTPSDVGSANTDVFTTLPTEDPALFGLNGSDIRRVNFDRTPAGDPIASGSFLTDEYAGVGVSMNNIEVSNNVYGNPASLPNATTTTFTPGLRLEFTFHVPVVAVGVINTSPDQNEIEYYSPQGVRLFKTRDQDNEPGGSYTYSIDRFVGARVNDGNLIGSFTLVNTTGQVELDELVFEVLKEQVFPNQYRYDVDAIDPAGLDLTYTLETGPQAMNIDASTGIITWSPTAADLGDNLVKVKVTNTQGLSDSQSFVLKVIANVPPVVSAGPDTATRTVGLPVSLAGTVNDDGIPADKTLTITWSKVSGPGTVIFSNATLPSTSAVFDQAGSYTLKLSASDGLEEQNDLVVVRVADPYQLAEPAGAAAWWPADGNTRDSVGGLLGKLHGNVSYVPGKVSLGFGLDGEKGFTDVPAHPNLDLGLSLSGFSIELWVKPDEYRDAPLLSWGNSTEGVSFRAANGGHQLYASLTDTNGRNHFISVENQFEAGVWQHVALTYDRKSGFARLFRNGILVAQKFLGVFVPQTSLDLNFGASVREKSYFKGTLDEISLYRRPLLPAEVFAIYAAGEEGKSSIAGPLVNAGPDLIVPSLSASLDGVVSDANPPLPVQVRWQMLSGPGSVVFSDGASVHTTAEFSANGVYVLKLTADDGLRSVSDTVEVRAGVTGIVPPGGLSAWWPLNASPVEVIHGGHDVMLANGADYMSGKVGMGISFDGVSSCALVPAHPDLDLGASPAGFTIELWAKPGANQDVPLVQWATEDDDGLSLRQWGFGTGLTAFLADTTGRTHVIGADGIFAVGEWNHVALTYDRTTGIARLFSNGLIVAEQKAGFFSVQTGYGLQFGSLIREGRYYRGTLDEVGFYDRPLSPDEIAAAYDAGANGKIPVGTDNAPVVSAGADIVLGTVGDVAQLNGQVLDDNKPFGPSVITWSLVEGPGSVNFADENAATTTATFTSPGTYLLRLTASDGFALPVSDLVEVRVGSLSIRPATGLTAWWPANGHAHEIVHGGHDVSLLQGMNYGTGKVAQAFSFDGINDSGRLSSHPDLDLGASAAGFSIELWVKPGKNQDEPLIQWSIGDYDGVSLRQWGFGTGLTGFLVDTTGRTYVIGADGVFTANTWTHVALTYDHVSGLARLYRDGSIVADQNVGVRTMQTAFDLQFGSLARDNLLYQGALDEISFYDRPLEPAEIQAIFAAGANGKIPGIVNTAPVVSLASNVSTTWGEALLLSGATVDDGLPNPPSTLSFEWSKISGPGAVAFSHPTETQTNVTFEAVGSYVLRYTASDSQLSAFSDITVVVHSPSPKVTITEPTQGQIAIAGHAVPIIANVTGNISQIDKIEFFDGAVLIGERAQPDSANGSTYTLPVASGFSAGDHLLTAKVFMVDGTTVVSDSRMLKVLPTAPSAPTLKFTSPASGTEVTAPIAVMGTAAGQYLTTYTVQLRYKTASNDAPWKTVAAGTVSVTNGILGQMDPSLLPNGLYEIRLTATDQINEYSIQPPYDWISITGGMKIGANTRTQVDLSIPTGGMPLSIVRRYDSTDSRMGDFGLGTTLANQAYVVQSSRTLGEDWFAYTVSGYLGVPEYVVDPSPPFEATGVEPKPRMVSVTLPDNTTFRFSARLTPNHKSSEITGGQIVFDAMPGTVGSLEAVNETTFEVDNEVLCDANFESTNLIGFEDGAPLDPHAFRLTTLDGTQYVISTTKGVLQVTDRRGVSTTYGPNRIEQSTGAAIDLVRDSAGRITAVKDQSGQSINYTYDPTGHLLTVTDREGRVTTFGYLEGTSLMTSIKEPAATLPEYDAYDAVGRLISKVDGALANGGTLTERDFANRVERHRDALNRVTSVEYDLFGNVIRRVNALGFETKYAFTDARFRDKPTTITDAEGGTTRYRYNAQGLVETVTDANGHATNYTYNTNGQILTETDALGRVQVQTYDGQGNLVTRTDREGNTTSFSYDATGNVLTEHSPLGNETRYTYNVNGLPLTETDYAPDNTPGRKRSYTYDANGNLVSETFHRTDPQGAEVAVITSYAHNLNGQPTRTTYPDGTFSLKTYNASGLLASESDRSGKVVNYTYDSAGRLTRTTFADGSYEEKTYDVVGRVTAERNVMGQSSTTTYDDADHVLAIEFPGIGIQSHTYDKVGRMLTDTDEGGRVTATAYDPVGNVTKVIYPDGTSTDLVYDEVDSLKSASSRVFFAPADSDIGYNPIPAGVDLSLPGALTENLTMPLVASSVSTTPSALPQIGMPFGYHATPASFTLRKAAGRTSTFGRRRALLAQASTTPPPAPAPRLYQYTYDANGRMKSITNPDNSSSSIEYDAVGRPTRTTNEERQDWTYEYDLSSNDPARRTAVKHGNDYLEQYHYDPSTGDMDWQVDPVGNITERHYNSQNQCTDIQYFDAHGALLSTEKFENFDQEGNPTQITDRENFVITIADSRTKNSKAGNRVLTRKVEGVDYVSTETYDEAGNLKKIVDPRGAVTAYEYDFFNRRILMALPDGRKIQTEYGPRNRVEKVREIASDNSDIHITEYKYDTADQVTQTIRSHTSAADTVTVDSTYAADGRATKISAPYLAGETPVNTSIVYDDVNRVVIVTDPMGRVTVRKHDKLGRLVEETDTAGTTTHRDYDELNRMTEIIVTGAPDPVSHAIVSVKTTMTYDALGNILSRTEGAGTEEARTTSYAYIYLKDGLQVTTTYADGSTSKSLQDTRGLVTSTTTPRGNKVATTYDALGRPLSVSGPLGQKSDYTYPNFGESQVITDAAGRITTRKFDASQRLIEEKLPGGFGSRFYTYDAFNKLKTVKNTRGYATTTDYDFLGRPTKMTRPDTTTINTTYTAMGQPRRVTDARGFVTQYDYDPVLHHLTSVTEAEGDVMARTVAYGYDAADRVNQVTAPNGQVTDSVFDAFGRLTKRTSTLDTDGSQYTESFTYYQTGELKVHSDIRGDTTHVYDALGHLRSLTDPLSQVTKTEYDSEGNLTKSTDAVDRVTTYTYDALNRLTNTILPQGATETNDYDTYHLIKRTLAPTTGAGVPIVTDFAYDDLDQVIRTTRHLAAGNVIESRRYDGEGLLTKETDAVGYETTYAYNALNQLEEITHPDTSTESFTYDGQGNRLKHTYLPVADDRTYTYTPHGEIETMVDGLGHTTSFTYDETGNLRTSTDPLGRVTVNDYDLANRLRKITRPGDRVSKFDYDTVGNRVAVTDASNHTRRYEYDSLGRLSRALTPLYDALSSMAGNHSDPSGSVVTIAGQKFAASQLTYDPVGNLETLTDPNNHKTTFKYDAGNRLTHTYLPANPITAYETNTYDYAGRRIARADADGATTIYGYDSLSRLISVLPSSVRIGANVSYTYDPRGLRSSMADGLGTTNYTYDNRGRLHAEQTPYAGTLTYTHDTLGRLTNQHSSTAGGTNTTYSYDDASRLTTVFDVRHNETTYYDYNDVDQLARVTQPNGAVTTQSYDTAGRPDVTTTKLGLGTLFSQRYSYTPTDQIDTLATTISRPVPFLPVHNGVGYTYDSSDRLLRESHVGDTINGEIDYTLDPAGNRTARSSTIPGVAAQSFVYDPNNALASLFTYDARGNPTAGPLFSGTFSDTYNYLDHHASRAGTVEYLYDGDGRRVGHRAFDSISGRWINHTRLISSLNPTGYDQDAEEFTDGVLTSSYTIGHSRLAGQRFVDEAVTAQGLTIALGTDGKVYAWGNGQTTPTLVPGLSGIIAVGAGASHYLALGADGKVYSWGTSNSSGQLGRAGALGTPAAIPGLDHVAAISTQLDHTLALTTDGTVYAWGDNSSGQLGDGTRANRETPVAVATGAVSIAAGQVHSYALMLDGKVESWGDNSYGQLGQAGVPHLLTPTKIPNLAGVSELAAGAFHVLALKSDGSLVTWGDNSFGQLGDPSALPSRSTPTSLSGITNLTAIAAGARHSLALQSDGTLLAWGENRSGQLGVLYPDDQYLPTTVSGLHGVVRFAAGARSSYAITTSGAVYVMGSNRNGQLGTGDTTAATVPQLLSAGTNPGFTEIAAGSEAGTTKTQQAIGLRDQFFAPDAQGHTRLLTDVVGNATRTYSYDAFGNLLNATDSSGYSLPASRYSLLSATNPYLYRGERFETETSRYHLRARDYDASLGRLATLDTYGGDPNSPLSLNRYAYAEANPVGNVDPTGHFSLSVWELLGEMDAINQQWDDFTTALHQGAQDVVMDYVNLPGTVTLIPKKQRTIWLNASRSGGLIGSLVGDAGGVRTAEGDTVGNSAGSDVFFHANANPRHRISLIERTVEQAWASAYNLRRSLNVGPPENVSNPLAAQRRWPAHLYHDAILQSQLRSQMIEGPVEGRFTRSADRKLYNHARTVLTATAVKNLNAAQSGGLLNWQSLAQPETNGVDAVFLRSAKDRGFELYTRYELFVEGLHEGYRTAAPGIGVFAGGAVFAFVPGGPSASAGFSGAVLSGIRSGLIFTGVKQTVNVAIGAQDKFSLGEAVTDTASIAALEVGFRIAPAIADQLEAVPFSQLAGQTVRFGRRVASRTINLADNLASASRAALGRGASAVGRELREEAAYQFENFAYHYKKKFGSDPYGRMFAVEPGKAEAGEVFITREKILARVSEVVDPKVAAIQFLDPKAKVGFRGSLARGFKGSHKGGGPFTPEDFDIDAFIVSDKLAKRIKMRNFFRDGGQIKDIKAIQNSIDDSLRASAGFKGFRKDPFTFRVFTEFEIQKQLKKPGEVQRYFGGIK